MKILVSILILAAVGFGAWKLFEQWDETSRKKELGISDRPKQIDQQSLIGMDARLENSLSEARKDAKELKGWLEKYRNTGLLQDPRLGAIELDYVVLVQARDPAEARRVFAAVKARTPPNSPLLPRIQQLEKSLQ